MTQIILNEVCKVYKGKGYEVPALQNINLHIENGEMLGIMGPSGSGKSTLLNILGCIDAVTSGEYILNGKEITKYTKKEKASLRNKQFGFILQDFALLENYSVQYNIELPMMYSGISKKDRTKKSRELMNTLGILDKSKMYPNILSGGQRQRVAIARALSNDANIILSDEPTGALDSKTSQEIMKLFHQINEMGKTIIIVTHDKMIADNCTRVINIIDGELKKQDILP
ncbi:MAG TPA: ABC transporter ATP-binding protein [Clostridiales bacterium]|nr:ABC transporter ATP-binding protein [Clostridiales bacterium]